MSQQKNYLHYRFFSRLFFYTVLLIAAVITLVISLMYVIFSNAMTEDSSRTARALLRRTSYSADVINRQIASLARTLISDATVYNYLTDPNVEPVEQFVTQRRLNDIIKAYPNIYRIGVYNARVDRYLTNTGYMLDKRAEQGALARLTPELTDYISFFPQLLPAWPDPSEGAAKIPVLTYVIYPGWISRQPEPSGFIIHVQESYIQETLRELASATDDNIFVINSDGLVLSHTQQNLFLQSFTDKDYVQKILEQSAPEGSFTARIDGQSQLISFVRSGMGWYFVNIQPSSQLLSSSTGVRNLMVVISAFILLAGTATAFLMARRLYNPIDSLLNKLNARPQRGRRQDDMEMLSTAYSQLNSQAISLQNTLESTFPVFKDAYLRSLLQAPAVSVLSTPQLLEQLDGSLNAGSYFVILLRIDDYQTYRKITPEATRKVHYFALCNIAREVIGKAYANHAVGTGDDEVALIAQAGSHNPHTLLQLAIDDLRFTLKQDFPFTISAAIGDWTDSRATIHISYSTAREYIQYRLFYGAGSTIDRSMVIGRLNAPGEYPADIDGQLAAALERLDEEKARDIVEKFFKAAGMMSYENALTYVNQFLDTPVKHYANLLNVRGESAQAYYQTARKIASLTTLNEMSEEACKFILQLMKTLQESKTLYGSQKLKNVLEWINANYCDSNISLEIIADKFEISSGYLGRLIYGVTYCHFNDYLNSLRLKRAAELLLNTQLPMEQICRDVGINNTSYFYTLFKKTYHTTPANYRKKKAP